MKRKITNKERLSFTFKSYGSFSTELKSISCTVFEFSNKIHNFNAILLLGHTFTLYSNVYLIKINKQKLKYAFATNSDSKMSA